MIKPGVQRAYKSFIMIEKLRYYNSVAMNVCLLANTPVIKHLVFIQKITSHESKKALSPVYHKNIFLKK